MLHSLVKKIKELIHFLGLIFKKATSTIWGPALIGVIVFGIFFDFTIVDPTNVEWLIREAGDSSQHYMGSLAFRLDEWHFPITKTTMICYPEGMTIIYSDSNPLLSILAKLVRGVFPPHYQFFGFWFLMCWILQSVFGYLLIKKLTGNATYALLSSVLFCLLPTQLHRLGHANLVGLWIILWAFYVFLNDNTSINKKGFYFFLILIISSLVHAYFLFMTLFIAGTWYISEILKMITDADTKKVLKFISIQVAYGFGLFIVLWIAGYFYNTAEANGLNGYDSYSMNLNAPFNPLYQKYSQFMSPLPFHGGQYEGHQYLGMGLILLLVFIAAFIIKKYKPYQTVGGLFFLAICFLFFLVKQDTIDFYDRFVVSLFFIIYGCLFYALYEKKEYKLLLLGIPATLCILYALSNKVVLGPTVLFEITLDDDNLIVPFLQKARSPGRFFWVTLLALLIIAVTLLYENIGRKSFILLPVIIAVQFLDLTNVQDLINSEYGKYHSLLDKSSEQQILSARSVKFISEFDMKIAEFALMNKKMINQFYVAHNYGQKTLDRLNQEQVDFKNNSRNKEDLYLFKSITNLPVNKTIGVSGFYHGFFSIPPVQNLSDTIYLLRYNPTDSLTGIMNAIKNKAMVVITVKDEAFSRLPLFFKQQMDSLYHTQLSKMQFRDSYLAVFNEGKLMTEVTSHDHAVEYKGEWRSYHLDIKSAGSEHGNESLMAINGINFSINERGLNVLVMEGNESFSSRASNSFSVSRFDTFDRDYKY